MINLRWFFLACALLTALAFPIEAAASRSVNVTQFGAKGDGVHDDSAAFQNALNYLATNLVSDSGVCLLVPAGDFLITKRLTFTTTRMDGDQGVMIRGVGEAPGQTKLSARSSEGIFLFSIFSGNNFRNFRIGLQDLRLTACQPQAGVAIEIAPQQDNMEMWVRVTPHLVNVTIDYDRPGSYFEYGLKGVHLRIPVLEHVTIRGHFPEMKAAVLLARGYYYYLNDSLIEGANIGIDAPYSAEGNQVNRCLISNVNVGVRTFVNPKEFSGPSGTSGGIFNSTIYARSIGFSMDRKSEAYVVNSTIAQQGSGAGFTNIFWNNVRNSFIIDNRLLGDPRRRGVVITGSGGFQNTISYNTFDPCATSIYLGPKVASSTVIGNRQAEPGIVNLGSNTYLKNDAYRTPFPSPAAAGTAQECLNWQVRAWPPVINVADFGALGDGVADDTEAISKAAAKLQAALDQGGQSSLYFPAGSYRLARTITLEERSKGWKKLSLFGDGRQVSTLFAAKSNGVFKINCTGQTQLSVYDLTLIATKPNSAPALDLVQRGGKPEGERSLVLHALEFETSRKGNYFQSAVRGQGLVRPLCKWVRFNLGDQGPGSVGFDFDGVWGTELEHSGGRAERGARIRSLGGDILCQGEFAAGGNFNDEFAVDAGGGRVAIQNFHINTFSSSLHQVAVRNAREFSFVDTFTISRMDEDLPGRGVFQLSDCAWVFIRNNTFGLQARPECRQRVTVELTGSHNRQVDISANRFTGPGTGIVIPKGTEDVQVYDNRFSKVSREIDCSEPTAKITLLPKE